MKALNLTAKDTAQERIKAFLEMTASDELANKINNGTPIEKDGKHLINRKTLDGFMTYATEEARKLAKGARSACIEAQTVFGWAIHYFEEDSIIGTLYNEDGSEYKTTPKQKATPKTPPKTAEKPSAPPKAEAPKQTPTQAPTPPQKKNTPTTSTSQMSIFDLF